MKTDSPYTQGHVMVAAVRLLEFKRQSPPASEEISEMIGVSIEQTMLVLNRLIDSEILGCVQKPGGARYFIVDHLKLETLPRTDNPNKLNDAIQEFKEKRGDVSKKVEDIQQQNKQKQQELFDKINAQLKKG